MPRLPFGNFAYTQWPMLVGVFSVVIGVSFLPPRPEILADQPPAKPNQKVKFEGTWDGKYQSNKPGDTGEGVYELHEDKNGRLTGKVTWVYHGKKERMELTGERLGPDSLRMQGVHNGTSYRYIGDIQGDQLVLPYVSSKAKESGFGVSWLTKK